MNAPDELRDGSRAAGWLNKLLSFVKMTRLVEGVGYRLIQTTRGTALEIQPGKGGGATGTMRRVLVTDYKNDYVVCSDVGAVAKPFRLTRSPFHGRSITFTDEQSRQYTASYVYYTAHRRKVTITTTGANRVSENQVIVPRYVPDLDYIYVMESAEDTGVVDEDGAAVTWVDINADGRAWARER